MRVHLIDGTFELFRHWFGAPPAKDSQGREVGATKGLLRSFATLLRDPHVTHVAVAFDSTVESFRNQLFDGYKTGEGIEPELLAQFPLAERAAEALGMVVWRMVEFEADDGLAAGAALCAANPSVDEILICSPDKDMAQCVDGERIVMFDRVRSVRTDEKGVWDKFGVAPASIPDWLALVGDPQDGLPGVPRWGKKSAGTVLARYPRLEYIPDDPAAWDVKVRGAKSLADNLVAHREDALLWRHLATLRRDVPLTESVADLRWRGPHEPELTTFCAELGMTPPRLK